MLDLRRACGGNPKWSIRVSRQIGPSPRLRGKRQPLVVVDVADGSIPAPAGETSTVRLPLPGRQVHPRACGGNQISPSKRTPTCGPSPRLRGKREPHRLVNHREGSIPAPAGETLPMPGFAALRWVHPRACGGNLPVSWILNLTPGPSPRLRGKPGITGRIYMSLRSIPAPAGETTSPSSPGPPIAVHPRACGGNPNANATGYLVPGPSPRLRGKHLDNTQGVEVNGSIPAPAGETSPAHPALTAYRVHPRACGGNIGLRTWKRKDLGPSPRLRGKRRTMSCTSDGDRSIPAPAGETCEGYLTCRQCMVHPRACGGNPAVLIRTMA